MRNTYYETLWLRALQAVSPAAASLALPVLRPGGLLSKRPRLRVSPRPTPDGQSVEEAIAGKAALIVEAAPDGKTLAYLLPVIRSEARHHLDGTRISRKALHKDVPFLERALSRTAHQAKVCYMKGRNNYLCRKKLYDLTNEPVLSGLEEIENSAPSRMGEDNPHR